MFSNQIKTLIKKNFIESYRTRELFIESAVPIIVAIMLSLKCIEIHTYHSITGGFKLDIADHVLSIR